MSELNINFGDRKIHAFDVDGTLMPGAVVEHACNKILSDGQRRLRDSEIERILSYKELDNNEYIRQVVQGFSEGTKGLSIKYLRRLANEVGEKDAANIFPEMQVILDSIKDAKEDIVLISGSPRIFVEALGRRLGATVSDGTHHYSARGIIHQTRPRRKTIHEKDKHLRSICRSLGGQAISAYGDSNNDISMLFSVPNPVAVNPLPGLKELAMDNNWQIIECGREN